MRAGRRLLIAGLVTGAIIRAIALPLPGTGDTLIWKVWSFAGASDVTAMYGVGGHPPERRVLRWRGTEMTVDYPPVALYELALAGRFYRAFVPAFDDTRALNVVVKLPGLLAEMALVAVILIAGRRWFTGPQITWAALAVWLNPASLLDGPVLGYLNPQMAVPLALAVLSISLDEAWLAGALTALAVATKAQAVFAAPVIGALILWRSSGRWRPAAEALLSGIAVAGLAVLPYVYRGAWRNLVQAVAHLATHDMLSAQAANIWWIFTWVVRVVNAGPSWGWTRALSQPNRILAITRAMELGYPNARDVGLALVALALGWAALRARRAASTADALALTSWSLYAYALLAAQVHENHAFAAVPLLALAAALAPDYRRVFWTISAIVSLNLYFFYGFGAGWPPLVRTTITGVDITVLLAVANVAVFVWFTRIVARRTRREPIAPAGAHQP